MKYFQFFNRADPLGFMLVFSRRGKGSFPKCFFTSQVAHIPVSNLSNTNLLRGYKVEHLSYDVKDSANYQSDRPMGSTMQNCKCRY